MYNDPTTNFTFTSYKAVYEVIARHEEIKENNSTDA